MLYTFPGWLVSSLSITTLVIYYFPKTSVVSSFKDQILFPFIFLHATEYWQNVDVMVLIIYNLPVYVLQFQYV